MILKIITCVVLNTLAASAFAVNWTPRLTDTWQWQLSGKINTNYAVNVYDIDLFDTPISTINTLKSQGKRVICYFSAGSSENWRPDFKYFASTDMGNSLAGWAGERWLNTNSANVRNIMKNRMILARDKGCDAVEPDNVDAYTNNPGFRLTYNTQLDYNQYLANTAHSLGLAIGLKNDVDQLSDLVSYFDFAVNEQCFQYNECGNYNIFTSQGKPVFNAEYAKKYVNNTNGARDIMCEQAKYAQITTLVLPLKLNDSFRYSCK